MFLFQFHKGTIKTLGLASSLLGGLLFQFHKGTIKTVVVVSMTTSSVNISIP